MYSQSTGIVFDGQVDFTLRPSAAGYNWLFETNVCICGCSFKLMIPYDRASVLSNDILKLDIENTACLVNYMLY